MAALTSLAGAVAIAPAAGPRSAGQRSAGASASLGASALASEFTPRFALRAAASQGASSKAARKLATTVCKVSVGDAAPNFSLLDQDGRSVSLSKFKGKNVVLYFYPADDTPGCTKQACSFRDAFEDFQQYGAVVLGVSGDTPESHKAFAAKYNLPYTLLSDEGNELRKEYGIPSDLFGILPGRQTYVIDKKGIVQLIFNNQFQTDKHIAETLQVLEGLKEETKPGFQLPKFPKLF